MSESAPLPILDRVIARFAPIRALQRAEARRALDVLLKYEAATVGRRTKNWRTGSTSANTEIGSSLTIARNRSRALTRDNGYARRAIEAIENNTIGAGGIRPSPKGPLAAKALELWEEWGETTEVDADGCMDFYGMQALAVRGMAEGGDVILRRRPRFASDGLAVPLQVQLLEGDFIDETKDDGLFGRTTSSGFKVQGVEFDGIGRRTKYWLFGNHPGDGRGALESFEVPAKDIIHAFRVERPGQVRGIPWGVAVFIRLRDLDETMDAAILRQKIANCLTAFVKRTDPESTTPADASEPTNPETISPGAVEVLRPGEDLTVLQPPLAGDFPSFASFTLHEIAAGFGITYEVLSGDHSKSNFHGGRLGWIEFHNSVRKWRSQIVVPMICSRVWRWFLEAAIAAGRLPDAPMKQFAVEWIPPRREMYDPQREGAARKTALRLGTSSLGELIREDGRNPDQVFANLAKEAEILEDLGLVSEGFPHMDANRMKKQTGGADEEEEELRRVLGPKGFAEALRVVSALVKARQD